MSYEKIGFDKFEVLKAEHLNHIEDGIEEISDGLNILEKELENIELEDGKSAYELALENGFKGSLNDWLDSLKGKNGLSAYETAQLGGYKGTLEDFYEILGNINSEPEEKLNYRTATSAEIKKLFN